MAPEPVSRRAILRSLGTAAVAGSVLRVLPLEAAQFAHSTIAAEKAAKGPYVPKYFLPHQFDTLKSLCETIIPADDDSGGAVEAGAPEFIDLLTSENEDYQRRLGGGLIALDAMCTDRYGSAYLECSPAQQKKALDAIAYRKSAEHDPSLGALVDFFGFLRNMTADGFFTSKIGIKYLGYVGNVFMSEFAGCPPVPGV